MELVQTNFIWYLHAIYKFEENYIFWTLQNIVAMYMEN